MNITVKRHTDDLERGDLVYHNHELLRVEFMGKWKWRNGRNERTYRFKRIGKINLDREWSKQRSTS